MRVCFFNRSYWPDTGATGQLLTELAEDLAAVHGWDVTVVTGPPVGAAAALPRDGRRHGVRIVRAPGTRFDPRRFAGRAANYVTYFLSACLAALRVPRCDVVVALTDPPIIGLAAFAAARRHRARFVFLSQDVFPEVAAVLEDFRSVAVDAVLDRVNRFLLHRADAVVAIGDSMRRRLVDGKGADGRRVHVIHNWADTRALAPGPRDNPFARAHGLHDRFVVMHAGNLGQSQALDAVLAAAERLREHDDIAFVFVGDGTRRAALEAYAAARHLRHVRFLPFQPREHMPQSYAAASIFLVSLRAGLSGFIVPSKVYSILAAGRGFIAAVDDDSEPAAIARDFGCGVCVPPADAAALAETILDLSRHPDRVAAFGARAREASFRFDRRRQVAAYAELLAGLARR